MNWYWKEQVCERDGSGRVAKSSYSLYIKWDDVSDKIYAWGNSGWKDVYSTIEFDTKFYGRRGNIITMLLEEDVLLELL